MRPFLCFLILLITGCAKSPATPELNLYIWSEYLDPQISADFSAKTGVRVNL